MEEKSQSFSDMHDEREDLEGELLVPSIPKRIYFFWENDKLSWMRYMTLFSFRKFNPDWEIILYLNKKATRKDRTWSTSEDQDFHAFKGIDVSEKLDQLDIEIRIWEGGSSSIPNLTPNVRSDVFRWEFLAENPGFYSDMDILYIRPIKEFYSRAKDANVVLCYTKYFSIGLIGSSGKNDFFRDVSKQSIKQVLTGCYQSGGVDALYKWLKRVGREQDGRFISKAGHAWRIFLKKYPYINFYNMKMSLIYPWKYTQMAQVFNRKNTKVPENCIGIHWYAGTEIAQKFNNLLTEDTFREYDNTFSVFASRILE